LRTQATPPFEISAKIIISLIYFVKKDTIEIIDPGSAAGMANKMKMNFSIPDEVKEICAKLEKAGFEAYLVGGCVRDILLAKEPKDWDVATNAKPEQTIELFPDSIYENEFGTVLVKPQIATSDKGQATGKEKIENNSMSHVACRMSPIEITTYRIEGKYTDKRHPDEVKFAKTIEEDLSRRDFTINAMAMRATSDKRQATRKKENSMSHAADSMSLADPFSGQADLKARIVRTVGNPEERFNEDALRLMRAVRFAMQLDDFSAGGGPASGWQIEPDTLAAIKKLSNQLEVIAKERVRDELVKILMTPNAAKGIMLLEELGLLKSVLPELHEGVGVGQNLHHVYSVFEHSIRALDYAAKQNYELPIRMAALLHDVGKPRSKRGEGYNSTFYQHEYISAKMALTALDRLRFPRDFVDKVVHLVRRHMFYYNVGDVSPAGVRRFLVRVGPENIDDLLKVREADRIGSGVAKAIPYKLRHLLFMIEKVKRDPLSPKMLAVNGDDIMEFLKLPQGMRVGWILHSLLEEVLDDPEKNMKEYLAKRAEKLNKMSDDELKKLTASAKEKEKEAEEEAEAEIKRKHRV
jgi:tRNA nucleotidyltransferase (CCA-adding enzyme)